MKTLFATFAVIIVAVGSAAADTTPVDPFKSKDDGKECVDEECDVTTECAWAYSNAACACCSNVSYHGLPVIHVKVCRPKRGAMPACSR